MSNASGAIPIEMSTWSQMSQVRPCCNPKTRKLLYLWQPRATFMHSSANEVDTVVSHAISAVNFSGVLALVITSLRATPIPKSPTVMKRCA